MSKYVITTATKDKFRFIVKDDNHEPIASSTDYKPSVAGVVSEIKLIQENACNAKITLEEDKTESEKGLVIQKYVGGDGNNDGKHRFRVLWNGNIIMKGEGYKSENGLEKGIDNLKEELGRAEIAYDSPELDPAASAKKDDTTKPSPIAGS